MCYHLKLYKYLLAFDGANWNITYSSPFNTNGWSAFGEDINGELYISGTISGNVYKIIEDNLSTNSFDISNFKMYPNPTENRLFFDFTNMALPTQISFYDVLGKLIKTETNFSDNLFSLSTQNFSKGLYLVAISDFNGNQAFKKLIVN